MYYSTNLGLAIPKDAIFDTNGIQNPVLNNVHKHQNHPGILAINEKYKDLKFSLYKIFLCDFIFIIDDVDVT